MEPTRTSTPALERVRAAYTALAQPYIELFGSAGRASAADRDVVARWARTIDGPVLDAGCGPGHWTAFLHDRGLRVEGVDATAAFVQHAERTYPHVRFRVGDLRTPDVAAVSLGGVLAWFSLIHLDPVEVPAALSAFAAALRPGGRVLLGYFSGAVLSTFDHRVVTAWAWPRAWIEDALAVAGFEVLDHGEQPQPTGRVFAHCTARRSPTAG